MVPLLPSSWSYTAHGARSGGGSTPPRVAAGRQAQPCSPIMAWPDAVQGHFSEKDASEKMHCLLDFIAYAHSKNIIHRDLKVSEGGRARHAGGRWQGLARRLMCVHHGFVRACRCMHGCAATAGESRRFLPRRAAAYY